MAVAEAVILMAVAEAVILMAVAEAVILMAVADATILMEETKCVLETALADIILMRVLIYMMVLN
jgi:hypothetical protein